MSRREEIYRKLAQKAEEAPRCAPGACESCDRARLEQAIAVADMNRASRRVAKFTVTSNSARNQVCTCYARRQAMSSPNGRVALTKLTIACRSSSVHVVASSVAQADHRKAAG